MPVRGSVAIIAMATLHHNPTSYEAGMPLPSEKDDRDFDAIGFCRFEGLFLWLQYSMAFDGVRTRERDGI